MQQIITQVQQAPAAQPARKKGLFGNCFKKRELPQPTTELRVVQRDPSKETNDIEVEVIQESPQTTERIILEKKVLITAQQQNYIIDVPDKTKKLLVLDLDETLVHSSFQPVTDSDLILDLAVTDPQPARFTLYIYTRPFLAEFLQQMAEMFEICVFTASMQVYCDAVMERIDPTKLCKYRLYRTHCTQRNQVYVKDLTLLGYEMNRVVIMDNSAISFSFQPENGILCPEFFNDKTDTYLRNVVPFMREISQAEDVREVLARSKQ